SLVSPWMKTSVGSATRIGRMGERRFSPATGARCCDATSGPCGKARTFRIRAPLRPPRSNVMNAPDRLPAIVPASPDIRGLEAHEAALKIARKFGHDKGIGRPEIVVYEAAFHGRSIATLSATGNPKIQAGFGPLVEGFVRVPLNDVAALEDVARTRPNVVA